jgi:hypothetical protein
VSRDRQIRGFDAASSTASAPRSARRMRCSRRRRKGSSAGVSERETTTRMMRAFGALGVKSFFHLPVALFGARTALPGAGATATSGRRRRGSPRATR